MGEFLEEEALDESVGEVSEDAADEEGDGDLGEEVVEEAFFPKDPEEGEGDEGDEEEDDGGPCGSVSEAEGDALVVDAVEVEDVFDDGDVGPGVFPGRGEAARSPRTS